MIKLKACNSIHSVIRIKKCAESHEHTVEEIDKR